MANDVSVDLGNSYIGSAYSPVVDIAETEDGHTVSITSADPDNPGQLVTNSYDVPDWSGDEEARRDAEEARQAAEVERQSAEEARAAAEQERVINEDVRRTAETIRSQAESERTSHESTRQGNEAQRQQAEVTREAHEQAREAASAAAVSNANSAATAASTAATRANGWADVAESAAGEARAATTAAQTATAAAQEATAAANTAAQNANTRADEAYAAATTAQDAANAADAAREGIQDDLADMQEQLDYKADTDGYYQQLTAGAADNLTGRGDPVGASYLHRTTAGTASVADDAEATVKAIYGRTLRWGQLVPSPSSVDVNASFATKTYADGVTTATATAKNSSAAFTVTHDLSSLANHKAMFSVDVLVGTQASSVPFRFMSSQAVSGNNSINVSTNSWQRVGLVVELSSAVTNYTSFYVYYGGSAIEVGDTVQIKNLNIFDLTAMFGAGNEPTTVAEFEALYPEPYYPYDAGSLLPVRMEGIETVGFNQWDEQWEVGGYNASTGAKLSASDRIRSKNAIPVFPSTEYFFKCTSNFNLFYYDADGSFISTQAVSTGTVGKAFTTPADAHELRFAVQPTYGTTYKGDICINLVWSGYRNGEYEPYWQQQRHIPVAEYFPDGMRSAGSVRDELTETEAVVRVGEVVIDGVNVRVSGVTQPTGSATARRCIVYLPSDCVTVTSSYYLQFSASNTFTPSVDTLSSASWKHGDAMLYPYNPPQNAFLCCIDGVTTAEEANAWFAAHPVTLHYPVTPTTTPIDPPLNMDYRYSDFGTERVMVPEGDMSAPPEMQVVYGINATDTIRNLPTDYVSAKSDANLTAALAAALGLTITRTWDEASQAYRYVVTSNE